MLSSIDNSLFGITTLPNVLLGTPCPTFPRVPTYKPLDSYLDPWLHSLYVTALCLVLEVCMFASPLIQTDSFQYQDQGPTCSVFGISFPSTTTSIMATKTKVNNGWNGRRTRTFAMYMAHRMHLLHAPVHPRSLSVPRHLQPLIHLVSTNLLQNDVQTQPSFSLGLPHSSFAGWFSRPTSRTTVALAWR